MKIKICGLTSEDEAEFISSQKVDFAGMVLFFEKSKRNITIDKAKSIIKMLSPDVKSVAVTVSPTYEQIEQICMAGFDYIQIHGQVDEKMLAKINIPIFKAFNVSDIDCYDRYKDIENIAGYVFDAAVPGGGKTFDWNQIKGIPRDDKLFIIAGGLNCDNVALAVQMLKPDCVDVSSGVEKDTGIGKDFEKVKKFVENAFKASN